MPITTSRPGATVFALHFLGGSAREWREVERLLPSRVRLVALDLPGFGDAAHVAGFSVAEMAGFIAGEIRARAPERWYLVGHSMGAKVAAAIARRAEDGDASLAGLAGVVLVAGSPPSPEPMDESRRAEMLGWFEGDARTNRSQARAYLEANAVALSPEWADRATDDVLRMNRAAWVAWLEHGSREDWSERIGTLRLPALIVAGEHDGDLGPPAQHALMLPHFENGRVTTISGAKHLMPMEAPAELAALIANATGGISGDARYDELIASPRVGSATRRALVERAAFNDSKYVPRCFDAPSYEILGALANTIVPQTGGTHVDLAARIDRELAEGTGDGWRFAALPPDSQAFVRGLTTLDRAARTRHGASFASLPNAQRNDLLAAIAAGTCGTAGEHEDAELSAAQMHAWFEDARAAAVRAYVLHPTILARLGYSGIANGGDGDPKTGFARIGLGEREPWEPVPHASDAL